MMTISLLHACRKKCVMESGYNRGRGQAPGRGRGRGRGRAPRGQGQQLPRRQTKRTPWEPHHGKFVPKFENLNLLRIRNQDGTDMFRSTWVALDAKIRQQLDRQGELLEQTSKPPEEIWARTSVDKTQFMTGNGPKADPADEPKGHGWILMLEEQGVYTVKDIVDNLRLETRTGMLAFSALAER